MSKIILKKNGTDYLFGFIPIHYPADRVYLDGDTTKSVQDKCARKADLTNLDLTGTTNTTGSTIASGTYFYLNGTLVRAKTAIQNGEDFTLGTNYEVATAGGLNDLYAEINKGYVTKTSTTTMTYAAFFNQLFVQIDTTKVTPRSYLRASNTIYVFTAYTTQGGFEFTSTGTSSSDFIIADIILNPEDSRFNISSRSTTTPYSMQNAPIGFTTTLYY